MNNVKLLPSGASCMGHRIGTAIANLDAICAALGDPTNDWRNDTDGDGKVTLAWVFQTPRGRAELRDYWWNAKDEWSIAAQDRKSAMWLARFLRRMGIDASSLTYSKAKRRM